MRPAKTNAAPAQRLAMRRQHHRVEQRLRRHLGRRHALAQQAEEALHVGKVRRARRHLHAAAVRHPLYLVQDARPAAAIVVHGIEEIPEGLQVAGGVVRVAPPAHEHQARMARQAALDVAVDALGLHHRLGDALTEHLLGALVAVLRGGRGRRQNDGPPTGARHFFAAWAAL